MTILCHFVPFSLPFLPVCPPFLHNNQTLSRFSQIPWATPAFSPSFSICLSPSSFCSLPLCSAHLQHIKIPLFFLQRIVQSLGDLLHSSMFSLLFSPYLSPCLCFGSATQPLIHSIFSFVCLTHLYPSKASLCFSSPFSYNNILIWYLSFFWPHPFSLFFYPRSTHSTCPRFFSC